MKYKKATYLLSDEAIKVLAEVADEWGVSRATTIELLLRRERFLAPFNGMEFVTHETRFVDQPRAGGYVMPAEPRFTDLVEAKAEPDAASERPLNIPTPGEIGKTIADMVAPLTVATPWQQLPAVREVDGSTGEVPQWVLDLLERLQLGEDPTEAEAYRLQRWRRGFDDEMTPVSVNE